jgi:dipicolinate synthase subunit A
MNNYSYLLVGGDKRQEYLYNSLLRKNKSVEKIFLNDNYDINENLNKISKADVIVLPIPSSTDGTTLFAPLYNPKIPLNSIIEEINKNAILFTGGENNLFTSCKAKRIVNLLSNEAMTLKNAMATAEATLEIIINNTNHTIFNSNILITGYGRIAKILTEYLLALKANVFVCARRELSRTEAEIAGAKAFGFNKLIEQLPSFNIIINTVPMLILGEKELKNVDSNALIIDLASKPGGVDFSAANTLKIKTMHALSLPGKYSPKTASEFIETVINNTLI